MFKPSAREIALVKAEGEQPEIVDDDDYDVYDAPVPIASRWKAWLALAGGIVATGLLAWTVTTFLDPPAPNANRPVPIATLGTMSPVPRPTQPSQTPPMQSTVPTVPRALLVDLRDPETLGGRARSSEEKPEPDSYLKTFTDGKLVSGAYGEPSTHNFVVMTAVTSSLLVYPDTQIDLLLNHLQTEDPNLTDLQPVYSGTLGGLASCGSSKFADVPKAVCAWVGEQSMGVLVWIGVPLAQAKDEMLTLRGEIEVPLVG
ncbi:hypothetical protein Rhe02_82000 [Rhizocola hellebori]|uniref:Uncharacterized protein n=1 Tax=Rhizocola hellebori TaxID=1392758 RepID=A0A8J3QIP6_9ACTN|nr:hypothetical protein [Rhizocola hellebori]GIH10133.1 hypothetical protein Rhe02_82000 [Rhizocola hellebori]